MLFNGERGRRRHRPRVRRGGRPHRRHDADAPRASPTPSPSWPSPTAAACTTPARSSTWTSSSPAPRRPTSSTSGCPSRRTSAASPRPRTRAAEDVTVVMLDRPRHEALAAEVREAGARLRFISDGDVAGAIMAARPDTGVDLLLGIGGTPEGIIAACAIKCLGGVIQGRLWPQDDEERQRALDAGPRPRRGAGHQRPRPRRELLLRRDGDHRRRAAAAASATAPAASTTHSLVMRSKSGHHPRSSRATTSSPSCAPTARSTSSTHPGHVGSERGASLVIGEALIDVVRRPRRRRRRARRRQPGQRRPRPGPPRAPGRLSRTRIGTDDRGARIASHLTRRGVELCARQPDRTPPPWPRPPWTQPARPTYRFDLHWDLAPADRAGPRARPPAHRLDRGHARARRRPRCWTPLRAGPRPAPRSPTTPTSRPRIMGEPQAVRAQVEQIVGARRRRQGRATRTSPWLYPGRRDARGDAALGPARPRGRRGDPRR